MGKRRKESAEFQPLTDFLAHHGFVNLSVGRNKFLEHLYQKEDRYVEVTVSFDFRDFPFYCRVSLGEGSTTWPEVDWNSVGLWQLIRRKAPGHFPADTQPYGLSSAEDVGPVILKVREDMETFGQDFLT